MNEIPEPASPGSEGGGGFLVSAADDRSAIPRRAAGDPCPLSFAQRRLWFMDQLEPGSLYNVAQAVRLCGPLDVTALRRGLDAIVARHEILRTSIETVDGEPLCVVADTGAVDWKEKEVPEAALAAELEEEVARPFSLSSGSLFRATLFTECAERRVLLLTMHHVVSDGWSLSILWRELAELYRAFRRGAEPDLAPLPIQYADFALWQRRSLAGEGIASQLAFWRKELEGAPRVLELPADRPRPATAAYAGASVPFRLSPALSAAVRDLCRRERVTLFMAMMAALQALLHRYSGQDDVLVGTPIANRHRLELEPLIGFFANTLVLRGRFGGNPTFRELLRRTRSTALDAFENQDVPFDKLVEDLRPERSGSHNPLFQVIFALEDGLRTGPALEGVAAFPIEAPLRRAKFDLSLTVVDSPEGLTGRWEYDTALFDAERIEAMAGHFQALLSAAAEDPGQAVSDLPLLSEGERTRIVEEWNRTDAPYPDATVTALFEEEAARRPDAIALQFRDLSWTYRELNARANRLAHALLALGLEREARIAVSIERSPETIVALLAIGKAGAAYVPLDAEYPEERRRRMAEDAGVSLLLVSGAAGRLPRIRTLDVSDTSPVEGQPDHDPPAAGNRDSLAYIMYTSGSTGTPKGVAVLHRGIVRLVRGARYVDFSESECFLHVSSLSFDASTFEIWGALANGARLVVAEPGVPSVADLESAIRAFGVTTLWLTAGLFHLIVDEHPEALASLRQVIAGGDVLSPPHVARALAALPRTRLINGYGPTETTTFACCHAIDRADARGGSIPIGRPIANTRVYILDPRGQPVPVGVRGELFIGGAGVARGYWNRPELTSERFLPDPFSAERGALFFRTGDFARYRRDGEIEFLGRSDGQVKIRGFRIEPAEIEASLEAHPQIRQAVVETVAGAGSERSLVAYLVLADPAAVSVHEIRRWAAARLPRYMIPSFFVVLETLPLSPSGKVDRRALPAPRTGREEPAVSAHDELELRLVRIWEDVLAVRPISVRDNFFALGGHSLLAVRLFAQIENLLGRRLPLATLFQTPTVEQLAAVLRQEGWSAPWSSLVIIQGGGDRPPFFCVPGVGGNVVGFHRLAEHLGADQPVYGLQARGLDGIQSPHTRVEEMAAHYVEQIRSVVPEGPYYLGGASFGGRVAFEMARQLDAAGQRVALVALFDAFAPGASAAPFPTVVRQSAERFAARVAFHFENLLREEQRGEYIRRKARTVRRRIRSRLWQLAYRMFAARSKHLPRALRSVREAGYLANRDYVPGRFAGRLTLFRAAVRSAADASGREMGWMPLAAEGVEVIPVSGDHEDMLVEPHVRKLAEELRAAIDRGMAETASPGATQRGAIR